MKIIFSITSAFLITIAFLGCKKYSNDYENYLADKEIQYPGLVKSTGYNTGNMRVELYWHPSPDPSIVKYIVNWNNGRNSIEVKAVSHDPQDFVKVIVPNLNEYVYSFVVTSYDKDGNKSIGQEINNVRAYGATYIATLLNRNFDASKPYEFATDGSLKLFFYKRDTMNVSTTIRYTNLSGISVDKELSANDNSISVADYKPNTKILYRSSYIPEPGSIDVFNVAQFDTFPVIIKITECNKSLFSELKLPTDISSEYGWVLPRIWDNISGQDQGFHTGGSGLPQWFTFDMGQVYKLNNFRLWQRESALYDVGNLKIFEVWGSNNPASDGSWSNWTKLQTFTSVKPSGLPRGQNSNADKTFAMAGEKFVFPESIPSVRYLRFKVLETWGGASYLHLSELTFYKTE